MDYPVTSTSPGVGSHAPAGSLGGGAALLRLLERARNVEEVEDLLLAAAVRANGALANPLCGVNSVYCSTGGGTFTSTDSIGSCWDRYSSASYDLTRGVLTVAFANAVAAPSYQGGAAASGMDQYRVEGVPPGTPLVFSAELNVNLNVYGFLCWPPGSLITTTGSATMREGESNASSASVTTPVMCSSLGCCAQTAGLQTVVRTTVTRAAGDPFTLHLDLIASGNGSGHGSAELRFAGLPPGARVVSCQGFRQDFPTAVKGMSWGRLKTIYR